MLEHRLTPIGGDDSESHPFGIGYPVLVGLIHGAGVKGRDLVVVEVCGDDTLGGEQPLELSKVMVGDL